MAFKGLGAAFFTAVCNEQVSSSIVNLKKLAQIRAVVFEKNVKTA